MIKYWSKPVWWKKKISEEYFSSTLPDHHNLFFSYFYALNHPPQ